MTERTAQVTPQDIADAFRPKYEVALLAEPPPAGVKRVAVCMIPCIAFPGPSKLEGEGTMIAVAAHDQEGKWHFVDTTREQRQEIGQAMVAKGCPTHVWHWAFLAQ